MTKSFNLLSSRRASKKIERNTHIERERERERETETEKRKKEEKKNEKKKCEYKHDDRKRKKSQKKTIANRLTILFFCFHSHITVLY